MNTIRITQEKFRELKERLFQHAPNEAVAFLLAGVFKNSKGTHFTVRDVMYPESEWYDIQGPVSLQVSPIFFNRVISRAERENLAVIMCHTHPFSEGNLEYSWSDNRGESISARTLYDCLSGKPVGSMLLGRDKVIGRIWKTPDGKPNIVDELRLIGRQYFIIPLGNHKDGNISQEIYSRQILAFGEIGQKFLSCLTVGIVGVGGTGSCVAESLARLGIRRFVVIDKDVVEPSNITRMYGTTYNNGKAKKPLKKAFVLKKYIEKIQPEACVKAKAINVVSKEALITLKECDIIFSCTDRHAPRAILNELAYQCFIPVIDLGVGLDTMDERIIGGSIRASLIGPELPCLYCQGVVRSDVIAAESLPQEEREVRRKEGYIPGIDDAPSVISFTTTAAGFGVSLFLDLLFRYTDTTASSIVMELNPLRLGRVSAQRSTDCVCIQREGRGNYMPFSTP